MSGQHLWRRRRHSRSQKKAKFGLLRSNFWEKLRGWSYCTSNAFQVLFGGLPFRGGPPRLQDSLFERCPTIRGNRCRALSKCPPRSIACCTYKTLEAAKIKKTPAAGGTAGTGRAPSTRPGCRCCSPSRGHTRTGSAGGAPGPVQRRGTLLQRHTPDHRCPSMLVPDETRWPSNPSMANGDKIKRPVSTKWQEWFKKNPFGKLVRIEAQRQKWNFNFLSPEKKNIPEQSSIWAWHAAG